MKLVVDKNFIPLRNILALVLSVLLCLQWMFGVTLWELMTLGQQPYADVDPFEMATYLREGFRISQPLNCPDEL